MQQLQDLPNLCFTKRALEVLKEDISLTKKARKESFKVLTFLDKFGPNKDFIGSKKLKKFSEGWYELRIRDGSNTWRILFRKIGSCTYGIVHMFLKDTNEISDRDWKIAKQLVRSENWI
ncbi:hypothetical protein Ccar_25955 (plasmid) [Clostridium carboxidivorans P7]|uniref:Type II toxin-antitoxin system RelE/ParE family toxin n=1 Tax=Clostridium carboxidivorans P7 TaxID=536227 RepID=C6PZY8_9CLOT|nr:type II toxin-antitoxin system RelE/ParE family toxin [Clostridium carboxidivorans]ADO12139.1 hypothetical protein Ccar_4299 [Clostridium carboxidivorans P7]AKN34274.1 hypothetical protein Ccar_25955 [Clostridium carboxidivorans P7]EET85198.1 protein of unknown function DUF891 [Clostridium carboxidivorans P7]EFG87527.1 phage derived protein Gp49-like (DUF891) [Clostridium carboxidivorans P7]